VPPLSVKGFFGGIAAIATAIGAVYALLLTLGVLQPAPTPTPQPLPAVVTLARSSRPARSSRRAPTR